MPLLDTFRTVPRLKRTLTFLMPDGWKGQVVDLSATGLRVQSLLVLDSNLELEGTLILPDGKQLTLKGVVVWAHPPEHAAGIPGEVGIELQEPPPEYHQALAALFAET